MRAAHSPSGLSSEFHAYGAVPRVVGKALARFATKHVRYFMPMTSRLGSLSSKPHIGRSTAGVMSACGRSPYAVSKRLSVAFAASFVALGAKLALAER